jgi:hypothetical protein
MPRITASQRQAFQRIKQHFSIPVLPSKDAWQDASNDDVWIRVVSQVVVVGNASPADKLWSQPIRKRIGWRSLTALSEAKAKKAIWSVLRDIGTRYCGKQSGSCRKTAALMRNLECLREFPNGPKGFLKEVATLNGSSLGKIKFVAKHLSYIKHKGARDFLTTGFGLIQDRIAFDTRILGVIRQIGVQIPDGVQADAALYEEFEQLLINEVCKPLGISGAQLDQLLFVNYDAIMDMLKR